MASAINIFWKCLKDNNLCGIIITSLKDRESGERKTMFFRFSKNTLRFYNEYTKETFDYMWAKKDEVERIEEVYYTDDGELMPF